MQTKCCSEAGPHWSADNTIARVSESVPMYELQSSGPRTIADQNQPATLTASHQHVERWTEAQRLVLRYLDWIGALDVAALSTATGMRAGEVIAALRVLRDLGHVARDGDCWRITGRAIAAADGDRAPA